MKEAERTTGIASILIGILAVALTLGLGPAGATAADIEIAVEAYSTGSADALFPDAPASKPEEELLEIWGHLEVLSYLAFDLSGLPAGFEIVGATVSVFDWETDYEDEVEIGLLNVPTDWDPNLLTYDIAVAGYGAMIDNG